MNKIGEYMSVLKNMKEDWYEDLDTYIENRPVEVLEENDFDDDNGTLKYLGVNSDTFDTESFSIWCDL